ncbi:hypothetical protein FQR65_LT19900 [Abscondita terminalis]|nr:hypothetical protein FQR65_LT19900 [Abscondita terminalis]
MLKASGRYEASNAAMKKFANLKPDDLRSIKFLQNPDYIPKLREQEALFTFEDSGMNDPKYSDFAGILTQDNTFYFTSSRSDQRHRETRFKTYFTCLYPGYWMQDMIEGDREKREVWARVLESRQQKGLPYLFFTDNVNRNKPEVYIDKEMKISSSNLCSEIALPSSEDESFVCCLSSMNLELYDEWKDTEAVKLATYFLDA